jgi:predicted ATPase
MKLIFVDNFRGFNKTFIPIKQVNFLVGENSTGKTSLLSLFKLLTSIHFWFTQDFDAEDVNFGHFKDIVSIGSKDRSYFSIGSLEFFKNKSRKGSKAILLTYVQEEGIPKLQRLTFNTEAKVIHLKFLKSTIQYKEEIFIKSENLSDFLKTHYNKWIEFHHQDFENYQILKKIPGLNWRELIPLISLFDDKKTELKRPRGFMIDLPNLFPVTWLAPIRTKPKRTYDEYKIDFSPEGIHTPYLIKKILDKKSSAEDFLEYIKRVGDLSGLFDTLEIKKYAKSSTSPFELDIVIKHKPISIEYVGYGVSQSLPLIVEFFARPSNTTFVIQQPEIHLHPKAQAMLGDIIFELAIRENKQFLIETHSDYLIDRFRLKQSKAHKMVDSQILFFESTTTGNNIFALEINKNGELPQDQPKSYRGFFIKEQMDLIGI